MRKIHHKLKVIGLIFITILLFTGMYSSSANSNQSTIDSEDNISDGNNTVVQESTEKIDPKFEDHNSSISEDIVENIIPDEIIYDTENLTIEEEYIEPTGRIIVESIAADEMLNSEVIIYEIKPDNSEEVVYTGMTEFDSLSIDLIRGVYRIEVKEENTIYFMQEMLQVNNIRKISAEFMKITLNPYDFSDNDLQDEYQIIDDDIIIWEGSLTSGSTESIYLKSGYYSIQSSYDIKTIDATADIIVPVLLIEKDKSIGLDEVAAFGDLVLNVSSYRQRPLQGVTVRWYNQSTSTSSCTTGGVGYTNSTGMVAFTLAPGTYKACSYYSSYGLAVWNESITISSSQTSIINLGLSIINIYTVGNKITYLINSSNGAILTSSAFSGSDGQIAYNVANGIYNVYIGGVLTYNVSVGRRDYVELGIKVNSAPTFTYINSAGRIIANQSTTVDVRVTDLDYDILDFYYSVNVGTVSISTPKWISDNIFGFILTFNSPFTTEFYELSLGVEDSSGAFNNYTLYLSNRYSNVTLKSREKNFVGINTYFQINEKMTGIVKFASYSGSDGDATISVPDGRYYYVLYQSNVYTSDYKRFDMNTYSYQFNWSKITINSTAEWGNPFTTSIYAYNGTKDTTSAIFYSSTDGVTGLRNLYLVPYSNYSIRTYSSNSIWKHNLSFIGAVHYNISYTFGTLAVYTFNNGNPENRYIGLYNGSRITGSYISYQYSGSDGIALFRLRPFSNYSVYDSYKTTWYNFNDILANKALAIADFTNSAPVISSIKTVPEYTRINANESVEITVLASDIDPIDVLNYTWSANIGSISGSGSTINYTAPSNLDSYRISVLVSDKFGGQDNTYIYVSNRLSTININTSRADGSGFNSYFSITRDRDNRNMYASWTGTNGLNSLSLYDGEYTIQSTSFNTYIGQSFIANNSIFNFDFEFAEFIFNTTFAMNSGISASISIYDPVNRNFISSINTGSSGVSSNILVAPGTYDISAFTLSNSRIWKDNVTILKNEVKTLDFLFAKLLVNVTSGFGNPINAYVILKNATNNFQNLDNRWISSDGLQTYYLAPTNYSLLINSYPNKLYENIFLSAYDYYYLEDRQSTMVVYTNNGTVAQSQSVYVYYANTTTNVISGSSGTDGIIEFTLSSGTYDVKIGSIIYEDVIVSGGDRIELNTRLNSAPVIISATGNRIGPNSQSSIVIRVSDLDYDYSSITLSTSLSTGYLSDVSERGHFTTTDLFYFTFTYNSPASLSLYLINITISDGEFSDTYSLFVSDQDNTLNIHSYRSDNATQYSLVRIYDYQSGSNIFSTSTSASTGLVSFTLQDGWYNIKISETNDIWFRNIWIVDAAIYNTTAIFGDVSIYSTGVGGSPLNSYIILTNYTDGSPIISTWSGGDGLLSYILAPGDYTIEVVESTSIFFNIRVIGGQSVFVGSEVPALASEPADIFYQYPTTGHQLTWDYSDSNPNYYNITIDGIPYVTSEWGGSSITMSIDGLDVGTHLIRIWVVDTYGFATYDLVSIFVTPPPEPYAGGPVNMDIEFESSILYNWTVSALVPDTYIIYFQNVIVESGTWSNGTINYYSDYLPSGIYNLTIVLFDIYSSSFKHSVFLDFLPDPTPVIVNSPDNSSYEFGREHSIYWIFDDNNPTSYTIYRNGLLVQSGSWMANNSINVNINGLIEGEYNYTIIVMDESNTTFTHSTFVNVTADITLPVITGVDDQIIYDKDYISLQWSIDEINLDTITVYFGSEDITSSVIIANQVVTIPSLTFIPGNYSLRIVVTDMGGNSAEDEVIITVLEYDNIPPSIVGLNNITLYVDDIYNIQWNITESNVNFYVLYIESVKQIIANWTDTISVMVDSSTVGSYNYTIVVTDKNGNFAMYTTMVNILKDEITEIDTNDLIFLQKVANIITGSNSSLELNWMINGTEPAYYEIYLDNVLLANKTWVSKDMITYRMDKMDTGSYELKFIAYNLAGDSISSNSTIFVIDESVVILPSIGSFPILFVIISIFAIAFMVINERARGRKL